MSKQDRQGARTPADLERKYEFGQRMSKLETTTKSQSEQLNRQEQELRNYKDSSEKRLSTLEKDFENAGKSVGTMKQNIMSLQIRMTNAEEKNRELSQVVYSVNKKVSDIDAAVSELDKKVSTLSGGDSSELLVTVQVDSLNSESISSDKTFTEIEEAIMVGSSVRVKLLSADENKIIYLHLGSHQVGVEINFFGYCNGLPVSLQILADENLEEESGG